MKFYIFLSVVVATLFFCANSEVCGWGYNLALSLLVLFLYWVRLIPSRLLESLNSAAAISIVTTLFLISSILLPAVRSEAMAVTAVFFHELIFLILSFRFAGLARAFGILTFGAFLASALLLCPDLQAGRNELSNWICVGLNLFFVAAALFLTYADIRIICLKVDKIFIPIILALGALFFILVAGYRDGGGERDILPYRLFPPDMQRIIRFSGADGPAVRKQWEGGGSPALFCPRKEEISGGEKSITVDPAETPGRRRETAGEKMFRNSERKPMSEPAIGKTRDMVIQRLERQSLPETFSDRRDAHGYQNTLLFHHGG